jgi:hypothetical protein
MASALTEEAKRLRARADSQIQAESPEAREADSVARAERFLCAGGVVSRVEWAALDDTTKAALAVAGRALERQRVETLASAIAAKLKEAR